MSRLLLTFPSLTVLLASPAVMAAENGINAQAAVLDTSSLVQMLLALAVVVVLIIGLSFAVRKFNMFTAGSSRHIRIVGGLALSNKDRLLLVQVGDEQLLISASPGRVQKVHEMQTPVAIETAGEGKAATGQSFASLLQAVTQRGRS